MPPCAPGPQGQNYGTLQVAYMAPTEILAKQHFESFIKYFEQFPINIGLITGSGCFKFPFKSRRGEATNISRAQLLKWVANGEIPVVIGTHALIQKSVAFKHLALVVIDEQHRFGTNQRRQLAKKEVRPAASPFDDGNPDPPARSHSLIWRPRPHAARPDAAGAQADHHADRQARRPRRRLPIDAARIKRRRQAYVICPRIDEPDPDKAFAIQAKSVKEEAKRLKIKVFPEYTIEILHSKMKPKEKDDTMARFAAHEIDILVATSVVEVGVNVPNATLIMIEGAERFGLSQLHQLRGRVVRSNTKRIVLSAPRRAAKRRWSD